MKKKVLVLGGGYSKERFISLKSAKAIIKSIKKIHNFKFSDPCGNFLRTVESFKPDVIFNALHGRFGEDGYMQSVLETLGVKYTHSGVKSSITPLGFCGVNIIFFVILVCSFKSINNCFELFNYI